MNLWFNVRSDYAYFLQIRDPSTRPASRSTRDVVIQLDERRQCSYADQGDVYEPRSFKQFVGRTDADISTHQTNIMSIID